MPLPAELDRKITRRFDELIEEVEQLLEELDEYNEDHYLNFKEWVVKTSGLLTTVFGESKQSEKYVNFVERDHGPGFYIVNGGPHKEILGSSIRTTLATLKGIRDNYINGFYVSLEKQITSNVSADYMEQAEALLGEEIQGKYSLRLAAMLCGVVLETRLRSHCEKRDPPLPTTKDGGDSLTLGALIQELDKVKAFDKQTRKLLKAWADIRNAAAHGEDDDFTREQVELMLLGVNGFLANHL